MQKEKFKHEDPGHKEDEGVRFDLGKARYDLIPGDSLDEVAKVYTYGATKYADNNWRKGMKWSRVFAPMMRHAWKFWRGESLDEESGCHHLSMVIWQCLTLMNYEKTHPEFDDRVKDLGDMIDKEREKNEKSKNLFGRLFRRKKISSRCKKEFWRSI